MTLKPDPDWWKTLFDDTYLVTDARSVCNDGITRQEVDVICGVVPMRQDQRILDLCGGHGRHAIELCARGFSRCCVYDYSDALLRIGEERAAPLSDPPKFVQGDARDIQMAKETFHHVLILGNSLGYIPDDDSDLEIVLESYRVLRSGGWIVVDVTDGGAVRQNLASTAWHEIDTDVVVCRRREINGDVVTARELVLSKEKGMIRDRTYCIRLYDPQSLFDLAEQAGFCDIKIHTDFGIPPSGEDRGCMDHRVMVVARKP